jgi:hypothetical protein
MAMCARGLTFVRLLLQVCAPAVSAPLLEKWVCARGAKSVFSRRVVYLQPERKAPVCICK